MDMPRETPQAPEIESLPTLRRLLARFWPSRGRAAGVFALQLLQTCLEIGYPVLVGAVVGALADHAGSGRLPSTFTTLVAVVAMIVAARSMNHYVTQVAATRLAQDIENRLRSDLFEHVTRLRFTYHDQNRSGKTITQCLRDMEQTKHFFREVWFGYLTVALLFSAVVAACFWTHWSYGVATIVTFGSGVAIVAAVGRRIAELDREVCDEYDHVTTVLQENVAGARVVRAFGRETPESGKFGKRMDSFSGGWAAMARYWTGRMPYVGMLYNAALPLVILIGTARIHNGLAGSEGFLAAFGSVPLAAGLGEVARVLLFCRLVNHRIRPFTRWVIMGQKAAASATRVFEILDRDELIEPPTQPRSLPEGGGGDLVLDDLHFAHRGGLSVLRGVSLHVPAGGSLGILGPTGAGKSTLVQLLPRFYDPDRGRILLDGVDLRDLDVHELRAAVGLVFQESFLFSGTVADNVAYGRPEATREEIEECVRLAAAESFVRALPEGFETIVGERGVSLSGGQRQRLTIARALAMNPRVLIFDDATASVDAVTEKQLFEGIRSAAAGRTTLVISQRVTSVRWCDRIAVLDGGVVTAIGSHAELLASNPLYQEIHRYQELSGTHGARP